MTRELRLTVRLSPLTCTRVKLRAEEQGITCAEYLRAILENDLRKGGSADALAQVNTEITLVTGMMVRELLTRTLGSTEAKSLEDWATGRASGIIQGETRDRKASA